MNLKRRRESEPNDADDVEDDLSSLLRDLKTMHVVESIIIKPLSASPTKWSNTLKQFVDKLLTNCLSVFDHFVKLALKGLKNSVIFFTFPWRDKLKMLQNFATQVKILQFLVLIPRIIFAICE